MRFGDVFKIAVLVLVLLLLQPVFRIFRLAEQLDAEALVYELEQEVELLR